MNVPCGKTFLMFSRVKTLFWHGICVANSRHFIVALSSETILRNSSHGAVELNKIYERIYSEIVGNDLCVVPREHTQVLPYKTNV